MNAIQLTVLILVTGVAVCAPNQEEARDYRQIEQIDENIYAELDPISTMLARQQRGDDPLIVIYKRAPNRTEVYPYGDIVLYEISQLSETRFETARYDGTHEELYYFAYPKGRNALLELANRALDRFIQPGSTSESTRIEFELTMIILGSSYKYGRYSGSYEDYWSHLSDDDLNSFMNLITGGMAKFSRLGV